MAELDASLSTTTNMNNVVNNFSVDPAYLNQAGNQPETFYDFPNAAQQLGYYKTIPELKKAIDSLAIWTVGKGLVTDPDVQVQLEHLKGWGEDTYQSIFENLIIQKKIFGDAFAEIVTEDNLLINLKPLYPGDMRVVVNGKGIITRYEQRTNTPNSEPKRFKPEDILHLCNDRIANEIHGTSVIDACKWVIDARNEALVDERKIKHRQLSLGTLYADTNDATQIAQLTTAYANAVKNGEVLVLPKDLAAIEDTRVTHEDRLQWIQYLEGFFYQAVGVPRVIASSQEYSEASSKIGYLTFEPIYTREQTLLEQDLWNQLAIRVRFNRPPSLGGFMQDSEEKNTGQTGMQPNELSATVQRNE